MSRVVKIPFPNHFELPIIPVTLSLSGNQISTSALVDSGSTVNVLPYEIGLQLGAIWEDQTIQLPLAGNLAQIEARGLLIDLQVELLGPVRLAFAWARSSEVPLILGQTNFFRTFDVCFCRSRSMVEITQLES